MPVSPVEGDKVLLRIELLLCAPTIRDWISGNRTSYYPTVEIGQPVMAPGVGRIVASEIPASHWEKTGRNPELAGLSMGQPNRPAVGTRRDRFGKRAGDFRHECADRVFRPARHWSTQARRGATRLRSCRVSWIDCGSDWSNKGRARHRHLWGLECCGLILNAHKSRCQALQMGDHEEMCGAHDDVGRSAASGKHRQRCGQQAFRQASADAVDPARRPPTTANPHPRARRDAPALIRAVVSRAGQRHSGHHRSVGSSMNTTHFLMVPAVWTSAAARTAADPFQFGELRGKEGMFAVAKARAEREAARRAAGAIGPSLERIGETRPGRSGATARAWTPNVRRTRPASRACPPRPRRRSASWQRHRTRKPGPGHGEPCRRTSVLQARCESWVPRSSSGSGRRACAPCCGPRDSRAASPWRQSSPGSEQRWTG